MRRQDRRYPGVSKFYDRHGKRRWRVRVKGRGTTLPGEYGSEEFVKAWDAYVNGRQNDIGANRAAPGTIDALIAGYLQSAEYANLKEGSTREVYRATLERFRSVNGKKQIKALTRPNIIELRDGLTPNASNNFLRAVRHLCKYAVERGKLPSDPTAGLKKVKTAKTDGHHTWTTEEIRQFAERHPIGTQAHLALLLLLYTGQRGRSDATQLGRQHEVDGGKAIRLRQEKTEKPLIIPIPAPLRAAIDACPRKGLSYLENSYGRPWGSNSNKGNKGKKGGGFGNWFRERCDEAGLKHCSAHGLRKSAATLIAEMGGTDHEIKSITGHSSLSEVQRYTKAAAQERLARKASALLVERLEGEQILGNPSEGLPIRASNSLKRKE